MIAEGKPQQTRKDKCMKMILSAEEGKKVVTALRQYAKDNDWTESDYEDFLAEEYGEIVDIAFRAIGLEVYVVTPEESELPLPLSDEEFQNFVNVARLFVNKDADDSYFTEEIADTLLSTLKHRLDDCELDEDVYDDVLAYYWCKLADTLDCHLVKKG